MVIIGSSNKREYTEVEDSNKSDQITNEYIKSEISYSGITIII